MQFRRTVLKKMALPEVVLKINRVPKNNAGRSIKKIMTLCAKRGEQIYVNFSCGKRKTRTKKKQDYTARRAKKKDATSGPRFPGGPKGGWVK